MQHSNCPFCNAENSVIQKTISQEFEYKEQKKIFDEYKVYECSQCLEQFERPEDNKDVEKQIIAFQRKVDGLLLPEEIKELRERLGLTQKDFAALLGVGEKSFTRYERGTVVQGRSMDNQLRLIQSNPDWAIKVLSKAEETKGVP
ncbi:MAG: hypothetical protein CSA81_14145 [Acidobacteria bacterium]|nr:MAG: hypothetical protein CSA81_14145 [Acidobacteriota bacterium]